MAVGTSPDPGVVGVRAGEAGVSVGVDAVRSGPVTPDGSSEPQAASAAVRASARTTLNRVTYLVVGEEANKHEGKKLHTGRGPVGKTAVVGAKDRPTNQVKTQVVGSTDAPTLQGFVHMETEFDAQVYTDEARAYEGLNRPHEAVKHSVGEYVKEQAHTNGMERELYISLTLPPLRERAQVLPTICRIYARSVLCQHQVPDRC